MSPDAGVLDARAARILLLLPILFAAASCSGRRSAPPAATLAPKPDPLLLLSMNPECESTGVAPDSVVEARFSRPPDPATVNGETFRLLEGQGGPAVEGGVEPVAEEPGTQASLFRLRPASPLKAPGRTYRIELSEKKICAPDGAHLDLSRSPAGSDLWFETGEAIDREPPLFYFFDRSAVAESPSVIHLSWWPAVDGPGGTPRSRLRYAIYVGRDPGAIDFGTPAALSGPGSTDARIGGLEPDIDYFFVIRARDERGNEDQNQMVLAGRTWPVDLAVLYTADVFGSLEPCG